MSMEEEEGKRNIEKSGIKLDDKKSTYGAIGYRISFPK